MSEVIDRESSTRVAPRRPIRVAADIESIAAAIRAQIANLPPRDERILFDLGEAGRLLVDLSSRTAMQNVAADIPADCGLTLEPKFLARIMNSVQEPRFGLLFGWMRFRGKIEIGLRLCDELAGRRFARNENISSLPLPTPTTDRELARQQLREYGFCIVRDAIGPDQLEALRKRMDEQAAAESAAEVEYRDGGRGASKERRGYRGDDVVENEASAEEAAPNQRIWCLQNKGQEFIELLENPVMLDLVWDYLDEDDPLVAIYSANIVGGGAEAQFLHTDLTGVNVGIPFALGVNCLFCLDDFTEANGATRVIPGSHIDENGLKPDNIYSIRGTACAEAPAGSAILFDMRLWHAGGASQPGQGRRRAAILTTQRCWTRGASNGVLATRPEVLETMSDRVKSMFGFKVTKGLGSLQTEPEGSIIGWNPDQLVPRMD